MQNFELTEDQWAVLERLAEKPGSVGTDDPVLRPLCDQRLIMGSPQRCHITRTGKDLVRKRAGKHDAARA